jgi:hypothetical protein
MTIVGVDHNFGKVTVLFQQVITSAAIAELKAIVQKWMKDRWHRKVRVRVGGVEEQIPFPD